MASFYGNDTGNHWQAYCEWNVTGETEDTVTITASTYFHSIAWGFQINYVNGGATIDGNQRFTTNNAVNIGSGQTANVHLVTHTVTLVKGDSPRTINIECAVRNTSSYMNGYSTGVVQYTIPAKEITTFTITYNANHGENAPAPQTKQKGVPLTITTQEPTRAGYIFQGWSTTYNGPVQYRPGGDFIPDENITLYAVWVYNTANAPRIVNSSVYRVANASSTVLMPSGNYAYFTIDWESGVALTDISGSCLLVTTQIALPREVQVQGDTTGTSGTCYGWFSASNTETYNLNLSFTNADLQTLDTLFRVEAYGSPIIDIANQGNGLGLLTEAPSDGVSLAGDTFKVTTSTIVKPALTYGWEATSDNPNAHVMTNTDEMFAANVTFGGWDDYDSSHTRIYRSGNYGFVYVPRATDDDSPVPIEIGGAVRVDAVGTTNVACSIYVEHTSGTSGTTNLRDSYGAGIITTPGGFVSQPIPPYVILLPRDTSGANIYRFSMRGRTTDSTGVVTYWYMTIKML